MTSSKNCSLLLKIIHEPAFAFFLFLTAIAKVMAAFAGANSSLFTLISYCAIVFSFALMFANGWFTACDGFYCASAYWLSHMKQ